MTCPRNTVIPLGKIVEHWLFRSPANTSKIN
jgi:hypothetical protein